MKENCNLLIKQAITATDAAIVKGTGKLEVLLVLVKTLSND